MSFFQNKQTEFEDQDCLVGALADTGLGTKQVTVNKTKQKLTGYGRGEAEIVIKQGAFGNHYQAGFSKGADGKFTFVSADDDRFDMKHLRRAYGERRTMSLAKAKGMKFVKREEVKAKDGSFTTKLIFQAAAAGTV